MESASASGGVTRVSAGESNEAKFGDEDEGEDNPFPPSFLSPPWFCSPCGWSWFVLWGLCFAESSYGGLVRFLALESTLR